MRRSRGLGDVYKRQGQVLANKNSQLDYTGKVKQARQTDIGTILRSSDPKALAKLKDYQPEEIAEAAHKNRMNDQQAAFLANELKKQDPEYAAKIENRRQALQDADNYQRVIGDLQVMKATYADSSKNDYFFDSKAAENDRDKIAEYFEQAGERGLADQVRKGWQLKDQTTVKKAIDQGITRIRLQAQKRLSPHMDSEGVRGSLQSIGFTPLQGGGMQDSGRFDPFSAPVPQWNGTPPANQPPAGTPFPQFIQGQQGGAPGAPPAPAPSKSMRPAASVGR
jgi:hypothetical protein